MPDTMLGLYLVALCLLAVAGTLVYRAIRTRLLARHAAKAALLFGTPERRKNGMDRFFALLGFLFEDQGALRDARLLVACLLLKGLAVGFVLVFVTMMFTPFFLQLEH